MGTGSSFRVFFAKRGSCPHSPASIFKAAGQEKSTMTHRLATPLLLLSALCLGAPAPADERPNIILIMGDDIGFSDLGAWGSEIDTPNLDRMANEGMRFTQFYNMAKCNPTRSCMMTGTFWGNARAQSLGALMTQAGYATLTSGKEHYDKWVPDRCKARNSYEKSFTHYGGAGPFFDHDPIKFHLNERALKFEEVENQTEPYYKTNVITDYAVRFLERVARRRQALLPVPRL
jgi:arylsulfatase A-like enzyme